MRLSRPIRHWKEVVCPEKNSQSKHPGVLFEDACTYIILLSLSGGPNSDFLLTWTSTAQFVDSDMNEGSPLVF